MASLQYTCTTKEGATRCYGRCLGLALIGGSLDGGACWFVVLGLGLVRRGRRRRRRRGGAAGGRVALLAGRAGLRASTRALLVVVAGTHATVPAAAAVHGAWAATTTSAAEVSTEVTAQIKHSHSLH